jgi:hypothetical protein
MAGDLPRRGDLSCSKVIAVRELYPWKRQSPVVRAVRFDCVVGLGQRVCILELHFGRFEITLCFDCDGRSEDLLDARSQD